MEQMFNNPHRTAHPGPLRGDGLQLTDKTLQLFMFVSAKKDQCDSTSFTVH